MRKLVVAVACFAAFGAIAGPFGLNKGMTVDELKKQGAFVPASRPFTYRATTIANGHPDFESYLVILTPQHGLCKILATGKDIDTSSFGNDLRAKYRDLVEALSQKYGAPRSKLDGLQAGSIWNEPRDWMMGLLRQERVLDSYWGMPENQVLPDSLTGIAVTTNALSNTRGFLRLAYEFDNIDACMKVFEAKKNSNL